MNTLVILLNKILQRYNINHKNVLGHSDIAFERKVDPGELFNWSYLAKKNLAFYPPIIKNNEEQNIFFFNLVTPALKSNSLKSY